MKKSMQNRVVTCTILLMSLLAPVNAGIYTQDYSPLNKDVNQTNSKFMSGDFEQIKRYEMIVFEDEEIQESSRETLKKATDYIKKLEDAGKYFEITLIGHSQRFNDDENEKRVASQSYASEIQRWFTSDLEQNQTLANTKEYVSQVKKYLQDQNISQDTIVVEYRGGEDEAYTQETSEGEALSNGVMLSVYVSKPVDIDSDRDGVFDKFDRCPGTPRGSKVDKNGCPIDSDGDGVIDYKDQCPDTPKGVFVDKKGCPLDSDNDGIVDYKDECPGSPTGVTVDPNGCALKSTLKLNFAPNSDKILQDSYSEIDRFAKFLKKNTAYEVEITGHTDSVGKAVMNMDLSQRRAKMTKEALVNEGVEASRIRTKGRGELDPIESNKTKEGRQANRRIEVELFLKEQ
ncbi:MAG: OmpA family protein [Campylobacterales bacterium]|nr:OmpA family protein [Campylobacterales bacterium]